MRIIEFIMDILNLFTEIRLAKRYGWGSFMWKLATFACLLITVLLFVAEQNILGTIGIIGCVACIVMECRQFWRDVRSKHEAEARKNTTDGKQQS